MKKLISVLCLALFSGASWSNEIRPLESSYDCSDKIEVAFSLQNVENLKTIEVWWFRPDGKIQERTLIDHSKSKPNMKISGLAYLNLHKPRGGGILAAFNPIIGMDSFIGQWEIKLKLNGATVKKTDLLVEC